MKKLIKLVCTTAACAFAVASAQADMYFLGGESNESNVGSSSSPVSWSDTTNWTPAVVPEGTDEVNWAPSKTGSHRHAYVSLDGDYAIGSLTTKYRTLHLYRDSQADKNPVTFTINTQLGGSGYQKCHEVNNGVKIVLPVGATMVCSAGDHDWSGLSVLTGGEADVFGAVQSRVMRINVASGGVLIFAPKSYAIHSWGRSDDDHDEINIGGGTASFPKGIEMTGTSSTPNNQLNQSNGTVTFGGNFTSELPWTYTWSGGMLNITNDCAFGANVALTIPADAAVTLDVANGKTFSVSSFTADSTAVVTKTGGGVFAFAPTEASVAVNAGGIGLATAMTYDLSNVTFAEGTTVALSALGATVNAYNSSLEENATFTADLSGATAGAVVLNSSDAALLEKAKAELAGSLPEGFGLSVNGTMLSVEVQSNYNFGGSGNILDGSFWGGSFPSAGMDVAITGATTVAILSYGEFPAWSSIEVKDGATLRIETNATLRAVTLNKDASLVVANDAVVTLANLGDLSGVATMQQIPVLSIASGSTLNVPGGMKFSNVHISLAGTVATTSAGGLTFGYAAPGDTTYIGLTSNGGTISVEPGSGDYNTSPLGFCCPAAGGIVSAVGDITLTDTAILPVYLRSEVTYPLTVAHQIGFYLGVNNPADSLFEVVFDNTQWGVLGSFFIKGGATFRLVNGGSYKNFESVGYWGRYAQISENGRLVVGSGCEFRLNSLGDYGTHALEVNPSSASHQAIVVEDGGIFETYRFSGNGKAVFAASNSIYRIYQPSQYNEHYSESSGTTTIYDTTNVPFAGFAAVSLAESSTLTFSTRNKVFWDSGQFDETSGDRVVSLADVPITGDNASVALSNANKNVFGVIVKSGANTATGTASVVAPAEGLGATTLYFANGANWAGTVVAGNVTLTNLVDAAAACTNSFGALDLAADFPFRVWKENGAIVANDVLNVGRYVDSGGLLVPTSVTGEAFERGDRIAVGRISKSAASTLPRAIRRWFATTEPIDGDDDNVMLVLVYGRGFQVVFR